MERQTLFADVIVPLSVPNKYTYRVPQDFNSSIQKGLRVLVPFGKSKLYTGIVYAIHDQAPKAYEAKYIEALLDDEPVVNATQLSFWDWLCFYYCANPGDVMNAALPSGLKLSSTSHVLLNPDFNFEEIDHHFFTPREHEIIEALQVHAQLTFEELAQSLSVKSAQPLVNKLLKKNAVLVYEDVKDKYKPKRQAFLTLHASHLEESTLRETLDRLEKKAFKQAEALLYFLHLRKTQGAGEESWVSKRDLLKQSDNAALAALVKKNILNEEEFEVGRLQFEKSTQGIKSLSPSQLTAYTQCKEAFDNKQTVLLHGVTGSGKTEIYMHLIKETVESGKQVLFLIPEIALTTQLITRLRAVFGETVGVYHSRFSENERVEIWNNVLHQDRNKTHSGNPSSSHNQYNIILGARSCLFLPFHRLGMIIVDEEHENSFKQYDPAPRYHARDSALYLAKLHEAKVILGSATPSIESWQLAEQGKIKKVSLPTQFAEKGGNHIEVCDIPYFEKTQQMKACLSPPLFHAVEEALAKKEQVILFQNRRGFAPYTECKQCGHVPHCVQCDVSLIYHKQQQKLVCHYCGYSITPPSTCSACGSNQLHFKGMGTEKIEEDVEILFPKAKLARMDLDSTRSKYAYKQLLDDFESGAIDILIGTQMVTKGLDFTNVSVVGVLNADSLFNFPDFRSFEKAFQLITQVKGRSGRGHAKGKVLIQTSQPEHPVIQSILSDNLPEFYRQITEERRQFNYPPFSRLVELQVVSKDVNEVNHLSNELAQLLKPSFGQNLLGPEFPLVSRIKNQYHKQILLKTSREQSPVHLREILFHAINTLQERYRNWRYKVVIDIDPV